MKRLFSLLILFLTVVSTEIISQSPEKDFVIVGIVSGDMNMVQIQMRYADASNVYFIKESSAGGVEQIANALEGLKINDLHIYTKSNGQELFLTGLPINIGNMNDSAVQLKRWKKCVSGKVVIHVENNTTSPELNNLLLKLGELSELEFKLAR